MRDVRGLFASAGPGSPERGPGFRSSVGRAIADRLTRPPASSLAFHGFAGARVGRRRLLVTFGARANHGGRVRAAAEHAPRGPFNLLERRHGLKEILGWRRGPRK